MVFEIEREIRKKKLDIVGNLSVFEGMMFFFIGENIKVVFDLEVYLDFMIVYYLKFELRIILDVVYNGYWENFEVVV